MTLEEQLVEQCERNRRRDVVQGRRQTALQRHQWRRASAPIHPARGVQVLPRRAGALGLALGSGAAAGVGGGHARRAGLREARRESKVS